ncbi:MAG: Ca2+-transporting ATPase [Alphaproteobacteria bacterium]|nr:MAG: Ca2+-transporting ATPase [Caulobacteraceae bacterium]TPW05355.1 MAG: Ca2+-transporting ATPase [Alphaproteobacteria bacterium]
MDEPIVDAAPWHTLDARECLRRLGVDPSSGLNADAAAERHALDGPNLIAEGARRPLWRMVLDQFSDFMILVLIAAAIVSGVVGDPQDSIAIVVIIAINAVIGFVQEYRAENAIAALRRMAAPHARVRRDGAVETIDAEALVVGDIVFLEAGAVAPADLRLIETARLQCAEAVLTGESVPVDKDAAHVAGPNAPVGERHGMAYKGALVTEGRGVGVVVAIGRQTEFGRIADLIRYAEEAKSPLQRRLARFGARLAWAVLAICAVVFVAGVLRGEPPTLMLLTAVSLAVAAIPEALPAVVSIALAFGAFRMARQHALIRKLPAVETLGSVTYVCTDKTGTLTENRMRMEAAWAPTASGEPSEAFYRALALCNDAQLGPNGAIGDPTEVALMEAAAAHGVAKPDVDAAAPRLAELPFSSDRRRMSTLHRLDDAYVSVVKGAVESLAPRLVGALSEDGAAPLDLGGVHAKAEQMAAAGLRVIAVAQRAFTDRPEEMDALEEELVFLGIAGLADPPRAGVKDAIALCKAAGVTPVMITGDHAATARAIAMRLGIIDDAQDAVMIGEELAALSPEALAERARSVRVYARVDPAQKIRIVEALQANGEYVAMTGDGVNDAPALKRAEIGVAMGRDGSDVAREAAHMILTDDNFATIVRAIREGRRIYDNVRKFIRYTMTSNSGEIWTIFLAPFVGMPIPLLPIHILWINLVTDGLPGLMLAGERAERNVMSRPPRAPSESVFAHGMGTHILWVGFLMGAVCLLVQAWALHVGSPNWQTMVFTVLTLSQLGHCLAIRSERNLLVEIGLASNLPLLWTVVATALLQMATIYVPALQPVFHTTALTAGELVVCIIASCVVFIAVEIEKLVRRRNLGLRA